MKPSREIELANEEFDILKRILAHKADAVDYRRLKVIRDRLKQVKRKPRMTP